MRLSLSQNGSLFEPTPLEDAPILRLTSSPGWCSFMMLVPRVPNPLQEAMLRKRPLAATFTTFAFPVRELPRTDMAISCGGLSETSTYSVLEHLSPQVRRRLVLGILQLVCEANREGP
jgi:hypothetical protein